MRNGEPYLNLHLAWQRLKQDRPQRCFVQHPYAINWIDSHRDNWLTAIDDRLNKGYSPAPALTCQAPKSGLLVRPGVVLDLADETVLNALVGEFLPQIYSTIGWSQGDPDIAYQLKEATGNSEWLRTGFKVWKEWREKALEKLKDGVQFVAVTDIAAFYENIDLGRLNSDLRTCEVDQEKLKLLMDLLREWAHPRAKGIPQGFSATDILAKLYISEIDQGLRDAGFTHLHYVDDIRIFCATRREARQALLKLSELIRSRGLNLHSAKTKIVHIGEARKLINGVTPIIETIIEERRDFLREDLSVSELVGALGSADELDTNDPPTEVLEEAFRSYFLVAEEGFDPTLFHYLLKRLGRASSEIAVQYCIEQLAQRPEESEYCLRYLAAVDHLESKAERILRFAASRDAIYDYQLYQIARTFYEANTFPGQLLKLCRGWAKDLNRERWLRTYSIAILGAAGNTSDLSAIETSYASATDELERAEIARALARMELSRRNAFYRRVRKNSDMVSWAIEDAQRLR